MDSLPAVGSGGSSPAVGPSSSLSLDGPGSDVGFGPSRSSGDELKSEFAANFFASAEARDRDRTSSNKPIKATALYPISSDIV